MEKNIDAMKWINPEMFENLTKIAEFEQQTSLIEANLFGGIFCKDLLIFFVCLLSFDNFIC